MFKLVYLREFLLPRPVEFCCEEVFAIHENPIVGKALYRFFARFAKKLVADFSVFKVETVNISFVGDENMIVFHFAL